MKIAGSIGEMFVLGFHGPTLPDWLTDFAGEFGLGGVILFDYDVGARRYERNVLDPEQVKALCADAAALPSAPLVFVDQEGGKVRRLKESRGFAPLPSALAFNTIPEPERGPLVSASFRELRNLGIHFNLAPVIDLNLNPENPDIGAVERSHSANPAEVRRYAGLYADAAREAGLGLCLKHYPGLGGAVVNSHDELTDLSGCILEEQLALFYGLAPTLPGQAILVSHGIAEQWDPGRPVSMSAVALDALREKLPGVLLLSDDLQMQGLQKAIGSREACIQGVRAGIDLLLIGNNLMDETLVCADFARALADTATAEPLLRQRVEAALERIRARKREFGGSLPRGETQP